MESPSLSISIIFLFVFSLLISSSKPLLSSTLGVDAISRILQIQDLERAPLSVQEAAARSLLLRLLPSHSSAFYFRIISKNQCGGEYCFTINNNNHPSFVTQRPPQILIEGTTGVEIVAGLHWYLKNWCGSHISWDKTGGSQLFSVPNVGFLPRVPDTGISVRRPIPWSYYQNAVTSSYSFAWWDWKRWEKEIDWMALQGINLPLAFTGQEAIWQKVFKEKFNMSISNLDDFFGGPAFLAWSRMGNLHGWGGPLPQSWFDQQLILQKKILARMYELGMTPVLPAFSGNVPAALLDFLKVGVGMSMEGIEQNPIVYDLMSEMAFQHKKIDVKVWVDLYSTRRYGRQVPLIQEGWNVLYHTIYNCTDGAYDKNRDVIVAFPDVDPSLFSLQHEHSRLYGKPYSRAIIKEVTDSFDQPHLWYSTSEVIHALELFISSGDELSKSSTYRYDLVDVTRQVLAKYANQLFFKVIEAYQSHDVHGVTLLSQRFLDLVEDLDALLACHDGFLLGPMIGKAVEIYFQL